MPLPRLLLCLLVAGAWAVPTLEFPPAWSASNYSLHLEAPGEAQDLAGALYFEQSVAFNRSALVPAIAGKQAFVADWSGTTFQRAPAVYFWTVGKSTCDYYCPILFTDQCSDESLLCDSDLLGQAVFVGNTVVRGMPVAHFHSNFTELYVVEHAVPSIPVWRHDNISDSDIVIDLWYGGFVAAPPPPAAWQVPGGVDQCPPGDDCLDLRRVWRVGRLGVSR